MDYSKRKTFIIILVVISFFQSKECVSNSEHELLPQNSSAKSAPAFLGSDGVVDVDDIMAKCNESFRISLNYLQDFNATSRFPDEIDKTPMCYIRCYFEKTGMIIDGTANKTRIRELWWPATGDSVDVCQKEGQNETNPCVVSYNIARCLMLRALVDARNGDVN